MEIIDARLICDQCSASLQHDMDCVGKPNVSEYYSVYTCINHANIYLCKICDKQIPVRKDMPFDKETHLLHHYGLEEFNIVDTSVYGMRTTHATVEERIPHLYLLKREQSIRTIVGKFTTTELYEEIPKSSFSCVICEHDYETFPTLEITLAHLYKKHGLINRPEISVSRREPCKYNGPNFAHSICNTHGRITKCNGKYHVTEIRELVPLMEVFNPIKVPTWCTVLSRRVKYTS